MADKPVTREEKYLAYLTGDYTGELPKPITRKEKYLYELCLKGIGGEVSPEEIKNAVNEYLEKNPVKPGATTEQAQQIEQNKTDIASLKAETSSLKEDISTKITKFYASNQGETHLADSDNGKIVDMMVYGKSEQKQYKGYQLLNDVFETGTISNITGELSDDNNRLRTKFFSKIKSGKIYHIELYNYESVTIAFRFYSDENTFIDSSSINKSGEFKTPELATLMKIVVIGTNQYKNNILISEQIDSHTYEPYTGGIPSPNPDYPQEVKSVVNPTVKVCGKNLLNYDAWKGVPLVNGTAVFENHGITLTATRNYCYTSYIFDSFIDAQIPVSEGEIVTMSWEAPDVKGGVFIFGNSSGKNSVSVNNADSKQLKYTVPNGITYITFRFGVTNAGDTISYKNIQIEKGSVVTPYEPYHEQTITLPYTLNAIPVSSGGNVTINGQQYIADYVDVERGKLVKKLKSFTISGIKAIFTWGINKYADNITGFYFYTSGNGLPETNNGVMTSTILRYNDDAWGGRNVGCTMSLGDNNYGILSVPTNMLEDISSDKNACASLVKICENTNAIFFYSMTSPIETDLAPEEIAAFKTLATYYPTTNISVNSEQLDGYTVFNYPISMENGWNYVKQQLNDNRDYIYDMDARTQDTDLQAAEAYVNSEYAVVLTELEV